MKQFKSHASRTAARIALRSAKQELSVRHPELKHPGARFIHGGPDNLKHPRWTRTEQ